MLQDRLDGFVAAGIMERRPSTQQPELYEYVLTEKGPTSRPPSSRSPNGATSWAAPDGPPILYRHAACGSPVVVGARCTACGELHDLDGIRALPGPGMPADRAERILERLAAEG